MTPHVTEQAHPPVVPLDCENADLLRRAVPLLEAAAAGRLVSMAAGDLLREVRARLACSGGRAGGAAETLAPPPQLNTPDIDAALAALIDLKPLVDSCTPVTYDTVQARRKSGLERAERTLLALRREFDSDQPRQPMTAATLSLSAGVKASVILRALNTGGGSYTLNQSLDEFDIARALAAGVSLAEDRPAPAASARTPEVQDGVDEVRRESVVCNSQAPVVAVPRKPTPAQRRRLEQIARGQITRSGSSWVYGLYHSTGVATGGITYTMMCALHDAGWITDESVGRDSYNLILTDAGRAAIGMSSELS